LRYHARTIFKYLKFFIKIMENMKNISVENILNRLKSAFVCKTDTDLAKYLGINQSRLSTWRSRGTIDILYILENIDDDINLNWLFYGEGEPVSEKKKEGDKEEILLLREKIKEKDEQIKKQEIQKEVLQETIMKMTFYDHNGEEEVPEMYVREVAENSVNYK